MGQGARGGLVAQGQAAGEGEPPALSRLQALPGQGVSGAGGPCLLGPLVQGDKGWGPEQQLWGPGGDLGAGGAACVLPGAQAASGSSL